MLRAGVSCSGLDLARGSPMSDSLLNHSWPSFSKRWKKRWSFKRGNGPWGQGAERVMGAGLWQGRLVLD